MTGVAIWSTINSNVSADVSSSTIYLKETWLNFVHQKIETEVFGDQIVVNMLLDKYFNIQSSISCLRDEVGDCVQFFVIFELICFNDSYSNSIIFKCPHVHVGHYCFIWCIDLIWGTITGLHVDHTNNGWRGFHKPDDVLLSCGEHHITLVPWRKFSDHAGVNSMEHLNF